MTATLIGPKSWSCTRDNQGDREYKVVYRVETSAATDGPAAVLLCPGLPAYGSTWSLDGDVDPWAWCRWNAEVKPDVDGEPNRFWTVELTFSSKYPDPSDRACKTAQVLDPLLEPIQIQGSFVKNKQEATADRFLNPIVNSAWEQIRGPHVEFDDNLPQVKFERNVANLDWPLLASMKNHVNMFPMWGQAARCVKLTDVTWSRKYYGLCYYYHTWSLTFDINPNSFDRDIMDEGTKALNGRWNNTTGHWDLVNIGGSPPDPNNPAHFCEFRDRTGNTTKCILNGHGLPVDVTEGAGTSVKTYGKIHVEFYDEADFSLLGLPATGWWE